MPVRTSDGGVELQAVPFATAPDLGGEYTLAVGDQRHRAVVNGIWVSLELVPVEWPLLLRIRNAIPTNWGVDVRQVGSNRPTWLRLRPNGTIVETNSFVGDQLHRVDMRIQRRFNIFGRTAVDGIIEVYNVFNRANYGGYTTSEVNTSYGLPTRNENVVYAPRMFQLGFRLTF